MWHLNIPIFRRLDKVAEHEKHAVLSLARTWWSFAEGVPQVLKTVRVKGLVPLTGPERKQAPRPLPPLPPLPVAPKEDISAQSTYNNDVSFEVLRAGARGAGSSIQSQGQRFSTEVQGGKVRAVKALPSLKFRLGSPAGV
mmetsp:Transcript_41398/g.89751  ORF Transcript_41398/g.89751 Transcript_41398/m.89751 type:complete len:140 (+) Transcript_41398:51-470(+)